MASELIEKCVKALQLIVNGHVYDKENLVSMYECPKHQLLAMDREQAIYGPDAQTIVNACSNDEIMAERQTNIILCQSQDSLFLEGPYESNMFALTTHFTSDKYMEDKTHFLLCFPLTRNKRQLKFPVCTLHLKNEKERQKIFTWLRRQARISHRDRNVSVVFNNITDIGKQLVENKIVALVQHAPPTPALKRRASSMNEDSGHIHNETMITEGSVERGGQHYKVVTFKDEVTKVRKRAPHEE